MLSKSPPQWILLLEANWACTHDVDSWIFGETKESFGRHLFPVELDLTTSVSVALAI